MLRITRLADYGTMILVYLAQQGDDGLRSANEVANGTHVMLPTVQKILKLLTRAGLVGSARGSGGGYCLARPATAISAREILEALDGPLALTECSTGESQCELEPLCHVSDVWQKINRALGAALDSISLADLAGPARQLSVSGLTQGITQTIMQQNP